MVEHTASQGDRDPDPERKEEENKRVGDDPGEVVWALIYRGAATMTKTDFALVLTLFWPTYRLKNKERNKFVTTNTWLTIPAFTGGVGLAVPGQSPREARGGMFKRWSLL